MSGSLGKAHQSAIRNQVGDAIRQARTDAGMRQPELATALGVSVTTISEWELGKKLPSLDRRDQIAQVLHINIDELCPDLGHVEKLTQNDKIRLDRINVGGKPRVVASKRDMVADTTDQNMTETKCQEDDRRDLFLILGELRGFFGMMAEEELRITKELVELARGSDNEEIGRIAEEIQAIGTRRMAKLDNLIDSIK
ncbi:helix-turn-helix domain-containing protein [Brytella acorum]|uniref:Helix-turn-helix domain-containing protein n=1 Tax=Brytella acorum TaxID=2959299 RepID=A0AA35UQU1_9PROT|nr:helix-turn-helix domain-containing protein [Brytella acorum]MDF3626143.1 helix-turn-helix domain-containing protein [Brytella acorum]CAI9122017.1 helix-turn-helix domain-containing protein [Brytella acorum]